MNLASCGRKQPTDSSVQEKLSHLQSSNVIVTQKWEQIALISASLGKIHVTQEGGTFIWISHFHCINTIPAILYFSPALLKTSAVDARN